MQFTGFNYNIQFVKFSGITKLCLV